MSTGSGIQGNASWARAAVGHRDISALVTRSNCSTVRCIARPSGRRLRLFSWNLCILCQILSPGRSQYRTSRAATASSICPSRKTIRYVTLVLGFSVIPITVPAYQPSSKPGARANTCAPIASVVPGSRGLPDVRSRFRGPPPGGGTGGGGGSGWPFVVTAPFIIGFSVVDDDDASMSSVVHSAVAVVECLKAPFIILRRLLCVSTNPSEGFGSTRIQSVQHAEIHSSVRFAHSDLGRHGAITMTVTSHR